MITSILTYELKVAILLAVFYMFYRLLLSKETFHKVNRCILLFTAIASFVLPFCVITYTRTEVAVQRAFSVEIGEGGLLMQIIEDDTSYFEENWWQIILLTIMVIGTLFVAFKTIHSIYIVKKIIREGEHKFLLDGTEIVVSDKATSGPFSWMHYIVMSPEDMSDSSRSIIRHEQGHIEYGHSWDIIITDLLTSIQWFNPAIWMLRSDLRALHEYQADDYALRSGINAKEYQLLLIKKAISMSGYSVANGFNHSILKNRITMMLSRKSSVRGLMKALYLIPAVGISLTAFAETKTIYVAAEEEVTNTVTESEVTENLAIEQEVEPVAPEGKKNKTPENIVDTDGDEDQVLVVVEEMPQFPGGDEALKMFIANSLKYPEEAREHGIQGRVFVSFVIDKGGNVTKVKMARGMDKNLDAEAMRVVSSMPKWTPGKQRGEAVNVSYTVPINFVLTDDGKKEKSAAQPAQATAPEAADTDEVFMMVEEFPVFPGGEVALRTYLKESVKYPQEAIAKGIQGRVFVSFVVDKEGNVRDVKPARKINKYLDAEAVRVVSAMPKWTPGKQRGKTVNVSFTVPVNFMLDAQDKETKSKGIDLAGYTYYIDGRLSNEEEFNSIPKTDITSVIPNPETKEVRVLTKVNVKDILTEPDETRPSFPGGINAMMAYLQANTKYPESQLAKKLNGRISVIVAVDTKGKLTIRTHEKGNEDFEKEAVRVVSSMPDWIPGVKQTQSVVFNIPVMFWVPEA